MVAKTTGCAKNPGVNVEGGTPPKTIREIRGFRGIRDPGFFVGS